MKNQQFFKGGRLTFYRLPEVELFSMASHLEIRTSIIQKKIKRSIMARLATNRCYVM
jgi:hypothetical protein